MKFFLWVTLHTVGTEIQKSVVGGVFVLVRDNIVCTEQTQFHTNCEMVWVKLEVAGVHPLCIHICAYYKPKEDDQGSLLELRRSIEKVNQRTNGPVNAHLISWPSKAHNIQNLEIYMVKK